MKPPDVLALLAERERSFWLAGLALYGVGDAATTLWGLSMSGIAEAGPVASPLVAAFDWPAVIAVKALTLAAFYAAWRLLPPPTRSAVPLALAVVGVVVTAWNLAVIASVSG